MKNSVSITTLILSLVLLFTDFAYADTANSGVKPFRFTDIFHYEKPAKKSEDQKKWFLNISGGYIKKDGNTDSVNTSYSSFIKYDDDHLVLKLNGSGSYGKYAGAVNDNRGTATFNFDYFLFWRIEFFSYTMSDYNKITLLKHRNGSGAGLKFYFIRNNYLLADLSGAPIYQYEKYEYKEAEEHSKWSIRGRLELFPFDNDFSIRYFAFYIPAINDRKNYRTIQDLSFYKKLASALGIRAGYRREYNTYDRQAFETNPLLKRTDSTAYFQLSLSL